MRDVPSDFSVLTEPSERVTTLILTGELDIGTLPRLDEAVAAARQAGAESFVVDLRRLRFLDSMGLEFLIRLNADTELVVVRGPRPVHRLFDVMHMESVLTIVDEPPEA